MIKLILIFQLVKMVIVMIIFNTNGRNETSVNIINQVLNKGCGPIISDNPGLLSKRKDMKESMESLISHFKLYRRIKF